jgi:hypothetical protein
MTDLAGSGKTTEPGPCDAAIRPFPVGNETEVRCEESHRDEKHSGTIRDYAYPGSETVISWVESDRRNFHGPWPGYCFRNLNCTLPRDHGGDCAY